MTRCSVSQVWILLQVLSVSELCSGNGFQTYVRAVSSASHISTMLIFTSSDQCCPPVLIRKGMSLLWTLQVIVTEIWRRLWVFAFYIQEKRLGITYEITLSIMRCNWLFFSSRPDCRLCDIFMIFNTSPMEVNVSFSFLYDSCQEVFTVCPTEMCLPPNKGQVCATLTTVFSFFVYYRMLLCCII